MRAPALATSLAEFWSNRWNTSFSALAHDEIIRPLKRVIQKKLLDVLSLEILAGKFKEGDQIEATCDRKDHDRLIFRKI